MLQRFTDWLTDPEAEDRNRARVLLYRALLNLVRPARGSSLTQELGKSRKFKDLPVVERLHPAVVLGPLFISDEELKILIEWDRRYARSFTLQDMQELEVLFVEDLVRDLVQHAESAVIERLQELTNMTVVEAAMVMDLGLVAVRRWKSPRGREPDRLRLLERLWAIADQLEKQGDLKAATEALARVAKVGRLAPTDAELDQDSPNQTFIAQLEEAASRRALPAPTPVEVVEVTVPEVQEPSEPVLEEADQG